MINAIAAYQPTKSVPDRQDLVRMQQQPVQAINELLTRVRAIDEIEDWHLVGDEGEPVFKNSWVNYVTGVNLCAFRKLSNGQVHIRGMVKSGSAANAIVFYLPTGYRPLIRHYVPSCSNNGASVSSVDTDGACRFTTNGSVVWSCFDSIYFWTD